MRKQTAMLLSIAVLCSCGDKQNRNNQQPTTHQTTIPVPAAVYENMADEKEFEEKRDNYFDLIHGNYPNWRKVNEENFATQAAQRAHMRKFRMTETFAAGEIEAEWRERGSRDIPGNIRICDFYPETETIYAISDGGTLWKGNLDGSGWTVLNDHLQLGRRVVKVVDNEGAVRIIAANGYRLRYSDDDGETWTNSEGFPGSSGTGIKLLQLNDDNQTLVYLYTTTNLISGSSQNKLAYSQDNGESFTFVANLPGGNSRFVSMDVPHGDDTAYLFAGNNTSYSFTGTTLTTIATGHSLEGFGRCMIQANNAEDALTLYTLMDNQKLYKSTDGGVSFDHVSDLPSSAWDVGFQVSIDDPDKLYYGEVNLLRSYDGGTTWELVSEWWEYYSDVANKIHADIMSIEPFKKADGTEFTLIPNHGGISVSYNNLLTTPNIAMEGLNTGQFYDVLTHPDNPALIFGGTQDQGFQRTTSGDGAEASSFEQVISGDYGEMQFTHSGNTIWIQYPGADFQIYTDAEEAGFYSYSFNVDGADMPNGDWIVPTGAAPHPEDNFIYVGGGNLSGGSGSYLIKLALEGEAIIATQFDFDFRAASGASISAIETTPLDDNMIYVVTENGRFFRSEDAGETFEMTESYVGPSGEWIYTADIYASRITPGLVFVGGTGYAGESVYMSTDNAASFTGLEGDMPNTMVHEMAMDASERFLFAAADAGPYVYSTLSEEWYNIAGLSAPLQQYISVEFVAAENLVRFATWGRGIWDFDMSALAGIDDSKKENEISLYPNPATRGGNLTINVPETSRLIAFDLNGRQISTQQMKKGTNVIEMVPFTAGTYLLQIIPESGGEMFTEKLIVR